MQLKGLFLESLLLQSSKPFGKEGREHCIRNRSRPRVVAPSQIDPMSQFKAYLGGIHVLHFQAISLGLL